MMNTKKILGSVLVLGCIALSAMPSTTFAHGCYGNGYGQGQGYCHQQYATAISIQQAKDIAFKHAGVTESEVTMKKMKLDYEHGVEVYEIEFYVGNIEYEYEINATTGTVEKFEKEAKHHNNRW